MKDVLLFTKNEGVSLRIDHAKHIISERTQFQKIDIWETERYGKLVFLNGWLQSIEHDEHIYHEFLVHPAFNLSNSECQDILIIGGGEGALLREVLKYRAVKQITMVDIDEDFINICKTHLCAFHQGAFENSKVKLVFEDGRAFLSKTNKKFDVIILDLTAPDRGTPSVFLYTYEWYLLCSRCLKSNGVLSTYALSANLGETFNFECIIRTIGNVFKSVLPLIVDMQVDGEKIGMVVASKDILSSVPFDIEESMRVKMLDPTISLDNVSLYRATLLPKYIKIEKGRLSTDKAPIFM